MPTDASDIAPAVALHGDGRGESVPSVTSNFHRPIGAPPEAAYAALRRVATLERLEAALEALGLNDRLVSSHWIESGGHAGGRSAGFGLAWQLADNGRAEFACTLTVHEYGDGGSLLSIALGARAGDAASRDRFLRAWPLLGSLAEIVARRTMSVVAELAAELADEPAAFEPVPLRAVS